MKRWYDGFTFGSSRNIYNPWSITNYLDKKKFAAYWAMTSSNQLVSSLLKTAPPNIKELMEDLLNGKEIVVTFDEQIVFEQLDRDENAIWSLLVAGGYLKVENVEYRGILLEPWYHLSITNLETMSMFFAMFQGWFSSFDGENHPSGKMQPERFYHGFVLGMLVELRDRYEVKSNRESGYGRYDVMLIPLSENDDAIILEFKVHDPSEEKNLEETVQAALAQIEKKKYDTELTEKGFTADQIRHYGFAFEGKKVLIGGNLQ